MTTLRSFQEEIEDISHKQLTKQRAVGHAEWEKEKKKASSKGIGKDPTDITPNAQENRNPIVNGPLNSEGHELSSNGQEVEDNDELQTLLLSNEQKHHERARDLIATLLTQHRGELILRFGTRPPNASIFSGQIKADGPWKGKCRTFEELNAMLDVLTSVADEMGCKVSVLFPHTKDKLRTALLLRLPPPTVALTPEVRCAVVGNVDSGKSTTLGVLTRGGLDDGRGRARVTLFRHKHEIESGRTSSVGMEILGFGPDGAPILPGTHGGDPTRREKLGWDEISMQAAKIISFIDLAGHERYLKTTLYGLTSGAASCVILMVGGNAGLIGMSKEHLAISLALNIPVVVCITKIDMTPPNILEETTKQVLKILKSPGCRKTPVFVKSLEMAVELAQVFAPERLCPIFQLSNVTGEGLDYIRTFLNLLPPSDGDGEKFDLDQPLEYSITDVWSVPYVGTVVNGILNAGRVKIGDSILLGPDSNGGWMPTVVKDIQRKRAPVTTADAGQCVSLALKRVRRAAVRKGMVIVSKTEVPPRATLHFEGQVLILYHNTTLQKNYQAMLHCGAIRQTVRIVSMDHPNGILRTGDRATVEFEFISHPEFIKEGMKLLFREGKTKGLGVITKVL